MHRVINDIVLSRQIERGVWRISRRFVCSVLGGSWQSNLSIDPAALLRVKGGRYEDTIMTRRT